MWLRHLPLQTSHREGPERYFLLSLSWSPSPQSLLSCTTPQNWYLSPRGGKGGRRKKRVKGIEGVLERGSKKAVFL
jgi:hypothetical protein